MDSEQSKSAFERGSVFVLVHEAVHMKRSGDTGVTWEAYAPRGAYLTLAGAMAAVETEWSVAGPGHWESLGYYDIYEVPLEE